MTKYTFTFDRDVENSFKSVLNRLDPTEYNIIEDIKLTDPANPRYSTRTTVIDMDSESCLTIRMALGNSIKIRRERTEEELAEEKALDDRHKIKITVQVPGLQVPGATGTTP